MELVKIGIKNYRPFGNEPQYFSILEKGFVSFVGPNNAGKTAVLKLIYEMRPMWEYLSTDIINPANREHNISLENTKTFNEIDEIFNHFTNGYITLFFEIDFISFELVIKKILGTPKNVFVKIDFKSINGKPLSQPIGVYQSGSNPSISYKENLQDGEYAQVSLDNVRDVFKLLRNVMFIPAFRNITNIGSIENYYDINIGSAFIKSFNEYKVGREKTKRDKIQMITEDIKNLLGFKSLNISASDDKSTLIVDIEGKSYVLEDLGTGIAQSIIVFTSIALKEPSYLLIDEPELGLHSSLQIKFLLSLAKYCSHGVLFATHSLGLARSVAEQIYFLRKENNETKIRPMSKTNNYTELLGELNYATYQELGFETLLLVEGATDVKVFQEFLRKWNKDQKILIINLGGSSMICKGRDVELAEIKRLNPKKICVWIDSEKDSEKTPLVTEREEFLKSCTNLGFIAKASNFRATENYFSKQAVSKLKGIETENLKPYEKLDQETQWSKNDNWRLAQLCDKKDFNDNDLGKFLDEL